MERALLHAVVTRCAVLSIEGFAIVSTDGKIATAARVQPPQLRNDADHRYYEAALNRASLVVHGRHSGDEMPRSRERVRLVLTTRVPGIAAHPDNPRARLWNPAGATFTEAREALGVRDGLVAILGGTDVFAHFLEVGYDAFHLSCASRAHIPDGIPVFPRVPPQTPEGILARYGLVPSTLVTLDAAAGVTLTVWRRLAH
jgi:hypothetical protein